MFYKSLNFGLFVAISACAGGAEKATDESEIQVEMCDDLHEVRTEISSDVKGLNKDLQAGWLDFKKDV